MTLATPDDHGAAPVVRRRVLVLLNPHAGRRRSLVCDHAAATGRRVPIGIVPAGTGNDVARAAGLHRHDPRAALEAVLRALEAPHVRTRAVDALRVSVTRPATGPEDEADGTGVVVTRHWAANSVNIGFDAQVNARANRLRRVPGPLRYLAALTLEARAFVPQELELTLDDGPRVRRRAALVSVRNGPSVGGVALLG